MLNIFIELIYKRNKAEKPREKQYWCDYFFSISFIFINLFLVSCAVNPVTGQNEFSLLSRQDEISIGNEQYGPSQQSQGGEYKVES